MLFTGEMTQMVIFNCTRLMELQMVVQRSRTSVTVQNYMKYPNIVSVSTVGS